LIDAGVSGKRIIEALCSIGENPSDISAVLISHEHSDHIRSAGIISRKLDVPIYANVKTWKSMEHSIGPVKLRIKGFLVPVRSL
jgi:phosphoribosyl 1,2-cyclic phosphodiesterase